MSVSGRNVAFTLAKQKPSEVDIWLHCVIMFLYRSSFAEGRSTWLRAGSILNTCVELNSVLPAKDLSLQSEILFICGLYLCACLSVSFSGSPFCDSPMRALGAG